MLALYGLLIATSVLIVTLLRHYLNKKSNYWKERGVTTLKSDLTISEILTASKSPVDYDGYNYNMLGNEKFGGTIELGTPTVLLKDLELIKQILVKDFDHFMDHRSFIDTDPLFSQSLFFLHGQEWRDMRAFLSPTFTSGKIRRMFPHFERCSERLKDYVHNNSPKLGNGFEVNVQGIIGRFTTDVIGAAAFGMETDALKKEDSQFYKMARQSSDIGTKRLLKFALFTFFPKVGNFFRMQAMDLNVSNFFVGLLKTAVLTREENSNEGREDFLQILTEAKAENKNGVDFSLDIAIQQAFLFLIAGFDSVGTLLGMATYFLAINPDMQQNVLKEAKECMENGKISYEAVNKQDYLDSFISEILRLYPQMSRIERQCTKEYRFPEGDLVIPKGMIIAIPTESIHHDERYYENPEEFRPERFSAENKAKRNPYTYFPFGTGPRNCIGSRFALAEAKVAITQLIRNFQVVPIEGVTPIPLKMWRRFGFNRVPRDLTLKFIPRIN